MNRSRPAFLLIRSAAGPAIALLIVAMFAGYALLGTNGLLKLGDYKRQIKVRQAQLADLNAERARLLNRKRLIEQGDRDMADELVRRSTDMVANDQVVVLTR